MALGLHPLGHRPTLVSPTTVGECASQEPPWRQVGMWYLAGRMVLQQDTASGADLLNRMSWCRFWCSACIPWAKGRLGLPYHCGGVRKPGTALVPRRDAAPGLGDLLFVEVCFDGRMIPQGDMTSGTNLLQQAKALLTCHDSCIDNHYTRGTHQVCPPCEGGLW